MNTVFATVAFALICGITCQAQGTDPNKKKEDGPCADPNCLNLEFPYKFCGADGKLHVKCTKDPNNERGLNPVKIRLPLEFEYLGNTLRPEVTGGDGVIKLGPPGTDTNFAYYPVFKADRMQGIIAAAAQRWSTPSLCASQGPDDEYAECRLKIRWSQNDVEVNHKSSAVTVKSIFPNQGCRISCEHSEIIINQQDRYLFRDAQGRPTYMLATERDNYGYIPDGYQYLDAYTAILHEIGHWLGFAHTDQMDEHGETCGDPTGIMKSTWFSRETGDLSRADECMFLKLYCCKKSQKIVWFDDPNLPPPGPPINHTKNLIGGADDNHLAVSFSVIPNPATSGKIMLSLHGPHEQGTRSVRIVDAAGNMVLDQQLDKEDTREVSLDVSILPNGLYIAQFIQGRHVYSQKFLISE